MIAPFDFFRVDAPDGMVWIEAVTELQTAKARVAALMQAKPCESFDFLPKDRAQNFNQTHLMGIVR